MIAERRLSLRLGDYRRVLLAALGLVEYPVAVVTVTAPGWDEYDPVHGLPQHETSEHKRWNCTAAIRWSRLDRRVKSQLRREGHRVELLARVAQRQKRGLDHLHLVLGLQDYAAVASTQRYVALLKESGAEYGFGFIDDPWRKRGQFKHSMVIGHGLVAAAYLTKYLTDGGESSQLVQLVNSADASWRALWVSPNLTRRSLVTCRRLRRVRHAWWVRAALDQGSRPTLPIWWRDLAERMRVMSLLGPQGLAAT